MSERDVMPVGGAAAARSGRLVQLDGLRGIAAIALMLYHVHNLFGLTLGFERAYLFVDLFFMLSGFVLSLAWTPAFEAGVDARSLLTARLRRLWPTVAAAAVLGASVAWMIGDTAYLPLKLVLALLLLPAIWQNNGLFPLNGPEWSILWELVANAAHVLVLRRLGGRGLVAVGLVMGLMTLAAISATGADASGPDGSSWWLALPRVGWAYVMGMVIARLHGTGRWRASTAWWPALALPAAIVLALPLLPGPVAAGDAGFVVLLPLLFWPIATARPPVGAARWLTRLGRLSFPLYAIHLPLLTLLAASDWPRPAAAALGAAASLLLAVVRWDGLATSARRVAARCQGARLGSPARWADTP